MSVLKCIRSVAAGTAVILLGATSPLVAQTQQPTNSDEGVVSSSLRPGDVIRLAGSRESDLPGEYAVDESGWVVLPLVGRKSVAGITPRQLKEQLVIAYREQLRNQDVQITLLRRVRVLGAVKNPGIYLVDPTMTVADAIALAGGATHEGKLKGVKILRGNQAIKSNLEYQTPLSEGLHSGDQIMIPERNWFSRNGQYVVGAVITALGFVIAQAITK